MHTTVAVSLFLSVALYPSSGEKCCETIKLELGDDHSTKLGKTVGIYNKQKTDKIRYNTKTIYNKENSNFIMNYYPDTAKIDEQYRKRWVVAVPGKLGLIRSSEQDSRVHCPSETKKWQYWKGGLFGGEWFGGEWVTDHTITIACLPEGIHQNVIIGASVVGGVFCAFFIYKRRNANLERDNMVDENPVYMYDYADPDENNEIYDTNAYYAVNDIYTDGSTVATDQNPEYE